MINRIIFLLITGTIAIAAIPASAQWYVGGAVGVTKAKIDDGVLPITGSTASSLNKDDTATVYGLAVGYDFTRNWALEGGYVDNGKFSARRTSTAGTVGTLGGQSKGNAWYATGIGKLPLQDQFYLFGKLGVAATTTKTNLDTTGAVTLPVGTSTSRKKSESNLLWGLGAGYDFDRALGFRLDYTQIQNVGDADTGEGDVHTLTAGIRYRF
jgi:OOP family OmpA-OmpF porin